MDGWNELFQVPDPELKRQIPLAGAWTSPTLGEELQYCDIRQENCLESHIGIIASFWWSRQVATRTSHAEDNGL